MKKTIFVLVLIMLTLFTTSAYAIQASLADLQALDKSSLKKFRYMPDMKRKSFSLYGGISKPYPGSPVDAAMAFLKENHKLFKISEDLSELKLNRTDRGPKTVGVDFDQYYKGVPIYFTGIGLEVDNENRIVAVGCNIKEIVNFNVEPAIKREDVEGLLKQAHPELWRIALVGKLLIFFSGNSPYLAYQVEAYKTNDMALYELIVDASTGKILQELRGLIEDKGK